MAYTYDDLPAANPRWWAAPKERAYLALAATVNALAGNSEQRSFDLLKYFRLYGNYNARGLAAGAYFRPSAGRNNRLTLNVVQSCVDTVTGKIAKNRPKPTFLTSGGNWSQQKKAKLLDKFCQGIFYQCDVPRVASEIFRDACVFGTGVVKVVENPDDPGRILIDRVFPDELLIDDMEAVYGKPRTITQRRTMSRDVLLALFPEYEKQIRAAKSATLGASTAAANEFSDLVTVYESWHLPSKKPPKVEDVEDEDDDEEWLAAQMKGHDGRHTITIDTCTLFYGPWRKMYFPFVFMHWTKPLRGFWGQGLSEQLLAIQYEINKILRKIQDSIDWCVPKAFVEAGSKVVLSHLDDVAGGIIRYTGQMPKIEALSTISPELFSQLDRLLRQAYEITGVSMLSAQAKKPSGLESGAALREYHDIETERFIMAGKAYEDFHLEIARQAIGVAKDIADRDGSYKVTTPQRRKMTIDIDWADIDLAEESFIMQIFPTSALPTTPAGRLAMVQDLMNLGFLDKEDVIRLLDFPDLEAVNELAEASAEFTNQQIEEMIDHGRPATPEPFQNLQYALKHAQAAYLLAVTMDVPMENLQLIQNYMDQCVAMSKQGEQALPSPGAQPGIPAGPPGPPPFGVPGAAPPDMAALAGLPPGMPPM